MTEKEIKEKYVEEFGKKAGNKKITTIISDLAKHGVIVELDELAPEPEQVEPEKEAVKIEPETKKQEPVKPKPGQATVIKTGDSSVRKGHMHLVFFQGTTQYWSGATIQSMAASGYFTASGGSPAQAQLPENTEYEYAANLSKCKSC